MTERGGRGGGGGSGRRAADSAVVTPTDEDFDGNETMSVVSNCSDMQTAAQLTDGKNHYLVHLYVCILHSVVGKLNHCGLLLVPEAVPDWYLV